MKFKNLLFLQKPQPQEEYFVKLDDHSLALILSYLNFFDAIHFHKTAHRHHDLVIALDHSAIINDGQFKVSGTYSDLNRFFTNRNKLITNTKKKAQQEQTKTFGLQIGGIVALSIPLLITVPILAMTTGIGEMMGNDICTKINRCITEKLNTLFLDLYFKQDSKKRELESAIRRIQESVDLAETKLNITRLR